MRTPPIVVRCPLCGTSYTRQEFVRLEWCGWMPEEGLELRHCPCGNTISVNLRGPKNDWVQIGYKSLLPDPLSTEPTAGIEPATY